MIVHSFRQDFTRVLTLGCVIAFSIMELGAEPAITSVDGRVENRQTVQVRGSGFGSKVPAAPILWADFEGGNVNPSSTGQRSAWNSVDNLVVTTENQAPGSLFNVVGTWDSAAGKRSFSFQVDKSAAQGNWTTIYHYMKRFYNFDTTGNQKFWRLGSNSSSNNFVTAWHGATGVCLNEGESNVSGVIGGFQGTAPAKNQWHTEEFIWQHSGGTGLNIDGSPGSGGTGIWEYIRNGVRNQHRQNVNNGANNLNNLITNNFTDSNHLAADGSKVYMDDIYIDDTLARVIIGNAATLTGSTQREIQIPSGWSGSTVDVTIHQGSFMEGDRVFLFVVDSGGRVSRGFPLVMGGQTSPAWGVSPAGIHRVHLSLPCVPWMSDFLPFRNGLWILGL